MLERPRVWKRVSERCHSRLDRTTSGLSVRSLPMLRRPSRPAPLRSCHVPSGCFSHIPSLSPCFPVV